MKRKFSKVLLLACLASGSLMAEGVESRYSLIGVEGGYNSVDVSKSQSSSSKQNMPFLGLKVGAELNDFRVFAGIRYFSGDDFDYITTYGAELQYLINFSDSMNFYFGANAGSVNIKFSPAGEDNYRTLSDTYFGGDIGLNKHLGEKTDLEIGVRYMGIDASNKINNVEYTFNSMINVYVSYIYKFKMD